MNPMPNTAPVQPLKKPEVDPVARSIAKPDAFSKPASFSKPGDQKGTRVRPMSWKRQRGRPRIHPRDKRDVTFF